MVTFWGIQFFSMCFFLEIENKKQAWHENLAKTVAIQNFTIQ